MLFKKVVLINSVIFCTLYPPLNPPLKGGKGWVRACKYPIF